MKKLIEPLLSRMKVNAGRYARRGMRVLGAMVGLLMVFSSAAQGAAPQDAPPPDPQAGLAVWTIHVVDSPPLFSFMTDRHMRYRADGTPCVAYGGDHLYFSCYNSASATWDTKIVDPSREVGAYAALAFNEQARPFISYYDGRFGRLKVAYNLNADWLGTPWTIMVVDTIVAMSLAEKPVDQNPQALSEVLDYVYNNDPLMLWQAEKDPAALAYKVIGIGKHTSIAIDHNNQVHVSYYDEVDGSLKYAFWNGIGPFQIEMIEDYHDQGDIGLWTSLAVDSENRPHISYMDEKYDDLKYTWKKNGNWFKRTPDGSHNVGPFTSLALDKNDLPHISYMDFSTNSLRYATMHSDMQTWTKVTVDSDGKVGLFSSIALDPQGRVNISYHDDSKGDLKFARSSTGGFTTMIAYSAGNAGWWTSVAIESNGMPAISFYDIDDATLRFTHVVNNKWTLLPAVGMSGDVGSATSLEINQFGTPHISYLNNSLSTLKYAYAYGVTWSLETVTGGVGSYSDIELWNDEWPVIAFHDMDFGELWIAFPFGLDWWFDPVDTRYNVGQYLDMDLDPNGFPHLSYYDATNQDLRYAYWDQFASEWVTETVDTPGDKGMFTSFVLDAAERPYISYYDAVQERLKLAYLTPINAWTSMTIDFVGDADDDFPVTQAWNSLAWDNLGNLHISYYDETYGDLRYAIFNGITWVTQTIDASSQDVGLYNSLVIDPVNNHRHICYYDNTYGDLKYAYWDGVVWTTSVVDSIGNVGMYCSIDLDGLGRPGISYYDASMGDLKFAASYDPLPMYTIFLPITIQP